MVGITDGIIDLPPVINLTRPHKGLQPTFIVDFSAQGTKDDFDPIPSLWFTWLFGDGKETIQKGLLETVNVYNEAKDYTITLKVKDTADNENQKQRTITIEGCSDGTPYGLCTYYRNDILSEDFCNSETKEIEQNCILCPFCPDGEVCDEDTGKCIDNQVDPECIDWDEEDDCLNYEGRDCYWDDDVCEECDDVDEGCNFWQTQDACEDDVCNLWINDYFLCDNPPCSCVWDGDECMINDTNQAPEPDAVCYGGAKYLTTCEGSASSYQVQITCDLINFYDFTPIDNYLDIVPPTEAEQEDALIEKYCPAECKNEIKDYPCGVTTAKVPFFTLLNAIIVVALLTAFYLLWKRQQ